ncbi:MAG TPA: hypothetical protein VF209_01350 [Patescibacteria group bacterium]
MNQAQKNIILFTKQSITKAESVDFLSELNQGLVETIAKLSDGDLVDFAFDAGYQNELIKLQGMLLAKKALLNFTQNGKDKEIYTFSRAGAQAFKEFLKEQCFINGTVYEVEESGFFNKKLYVKFIE